MKRALMCLFVLVLSNGCMSTGGLVVGPISALSAKRNETRVRERAAYAVEEIKRPQVVRAMRSGMSDSEIAVGVGIDLLALREAVQDEKLTTGELTTQTVAALLDVAAEIAVGKELLDRLDDSGSSAPALPPALQVSGNGNTIVTDNSAPVTVDNSRTQ